MPPNRFFIYAAFFCFALAQAQNDSLYTKNEKFEEAKVGTSYLPSPEANRHFEPNFRRKYTGSDFDYEHKAVEKSMWERFKEWLAYLIARLFKMTNPEASMNYAGNFLKGLAISIVLGVGYLIYRIYRKNEAGWIFGKKDSRFSVDGEEIIDIQTANFEDLIKNASQNGDRRLAVRYYYLWFLQQLSDRRLIEWDAEKTTLDYLRELKDPKLKDEFSYLSYLYDHAWYGDIVFDQEIFDRTTIGFEHAINSLR